MLALAGCGSVPRQAAAPSGTLAKPDHAKTWPTQPAAGSGRGGYYKDDGPGDNPPPNLDLVPDAQVRIEPYSPRANRPYAVFGRTYTPITDERPFIQSGIGSWYGKKFHGQRTSSGELYDMYKMTAAHPTLPIPSYARLTSAVSGKQVIVRINDRGPFHSSRAIDVSYTAALKLGLLGKGSHELQIERLLPSDIERMTATRAAPYMPVSIALATTSRAAAADARAPAPTVARNSFYLQLAAFSRIDAAHAMRAQLEPQATGLGALEVVQAGEVYRVYGGPFQSRQEALQAAQALPDGLTKPIIVQR